MQTYAELIDQLDEPVLLAQLDLPKHKTLKDHLWCLIGARESYARALEQGQWQGFNCSLSRYTLADFKTALQSSAQAVQSVLEGISDWSSERDQLLLTLAEHEVMHEGQIIRHMYALNQSLPASWRWA